MPTYAYQCEKCGNRFEVVQHISSRKKPACPKCKASAVQQVMGAFYAKTIKKS